METGSGTGTGGVSIGNVPVDQGDKYEEQGVEEEQRVEMVRVTKVTTETQSLEAAAEQEVYCREGTRVQMHSVPPPSNRLRIMRSAEFGEDEVLTKSGGGGGQLEGRAEFENSLQNDADRNRD